MKTWSRLLAIRTVSNRKFGHDFQDEAIIQAQARRAAAIFRPVIAVDCSKSVLGREIITGEPLFGQCSERRENPNDETARRVLPGMAEQEGFARIIRLSELSE